MIILHKLALQHRSQFHLNPDMITTIEAHPDTVVTLATGRKVTGRRDAPTRSARRDHGLARGHPRRGLAEPPGRGQ